MHVKESFWMVSRGLPLDRNVLAAGSGCGTRAAHKESGVAAMLYGRYHGQILGLAIRSGGMAVGKQSCAKSWPSSTTTAETSPAPAIA